MIIVYLFFLANLGVPFFQKDMVLSMLNPYRFEEVHMRKIKAFLQGSFAFYMYTEKYHTECVHSSNANVRGQKHEYANKRYR